MPAPSRSSEDGYMVNTIKVLCNAYGINIIAAGIETLASEPSKMDGN